jgi:acyl-CoA synthetase (AMP-forming)/AMP-acid ligase II/NAD(P)-dependent dehydrogenase (short-subunit alcohol dehydrogenase family)/acyl carrier protein
MTTAHDVKQTLKPHLDNGLELWLEAGALRFKAPKELLTPDLMAVLKANKPRILEWLQAEAEQSQASAEPELVDEYPLAFTQGAIWMLYKFAPNSPAYNTTFACTLAADIDENAVRQAFHALLVRHPVLRSTFTDTEFGPRQRVWSHIDMPLQIIDGSQWSESQLQQQLDQEADAAFDLQTQSCLRVKIVKDTVQGDILIATIQHVGADLWALLIVAQDIKDFYAKAAKGEALSVQPISATYRQHVEWQQFFMDSVKGRQERFYWKQQLHGAPLAISLPEDMQRPALLKLQTSTIKQLVSADVYQNIKQFCKANSITPFVFVQSAFQIMVHHYAGAHDFLIGTPTMGRSRKGMDQVVGDFANPVVLRAKVQPELSVKQLFIRVKKTLLAAMEHQECPFPIVVQDCNPPRDSSRTPLFQLMFVWHQGNAEMMPKDGFIKDVLPMSGPRGAPYDIMLAVSDLGDHFELNWTYQTSLYQAASVHLYADAVQSLMAKFLATDLAENVASVASSLPARSVDALTSERSSNLTQQHGCELHDQALEVAPILNLVPSTALTELNAQGEMINRLFVMAAYEQIAPVHQALLDLYHDIVLLPSFPRTLSGDVDEWALRQISCLDQQKLDAHLKPLGIAGSDVVVLRSRALLPTFSDDDLHAEEESKGSGVVALPVVQLDQRPDAWMVGDTLNVATSISTNATPTHLFDALTQTAQRFPQKGFLFVDDQGIQELYTYAALVEDAFVTAAGLQQNDIRAGDIVLLQMPFDKRFFAVWWGAVLSGVWPLVVAMPEHYHDRNGVAQKLYNVSHSFDDLVVVADTNRVQATRQWLGESRRVLDAALLLRTDAVFEPAVRSADSVAFLQLTSGSTGTPKAIQITHHGVLHHVAASAAYNGYSHDDVSLNWLPFDHVVPILTTHLKDVVLGIQQIQLPTAMVLADPLKWLRFISDFRVSYSWAPNFAYQRIVDALKQSSDLRGLDLHCVKILMNAGEQVLAPVVNAFSAALAPYGLHKNAVQPAFGMAEACTCMTYNNDSSDRIAVHFRTTDDPAVVDVVSKDLASHGFVDLGGVVPGVEVRITDEKNQLVKEGVIGRMQIRGPVITPGYLHNPAANKEAFVGDGWFNSGDLGFIWDKRLILTGREKEMIVVNGANYYCFELEQVASTLPDVLPTFVAATGVTLNAGENSDALVLFYVTDSEGDTTELERQIIARVAESFSVVAQYAIAVSKEGFYKTTSGKIQRSQFKKLFELGFYDEQIASFSERHGEKQDAIDTVFSFDYQAVNFDVSMQANTANVFQYKAGCVQSLEGFLQSVDASSAEHTVIDLGYTNMQLASATDDLLMLARQFADVGHVLSGITPASQITLWLKCDDAAALLLVKPLVETLRQETGNAQLSCVLSTADQLPMPPQPGMIAWQNENCHSSVQLVNVVKNALPHDVIPRKGVFLITGGLGGLSEPLCEYLVNQRKATLLLSGRAKLAENPKRQSQFNQLRARFGSQNIHYLPLPDWQASTLQAHIKVALESCGHPQLDGVFHLAGHMEMQPLDALDSGHWQAVMQSKAEGSLSLAQYLQEHWPRSLLIQYGSLNSYFGGQSAAAYSAANAIQSQVTQYLNEHTRIRSWCLNWSVWQGEGMAAQFSQAELQMARNKGFLPLNVARDTQLIPKLLQLPPENYFIGIDPSNAEIQKQVIGLVRSAEQIDVYVDCSRFAPLDEKRQSIMQGVQRSLLDINPHAHNPQLNIHLSEEAFERDANGLVLVEALQQKTAGQDDDGEQPANQTEADIAAIWSDVLGRTVNDVSRSFFEYGGHSINATQVVSTINNKLGLPITVAHLFQYPTIRELAQLVGSDSGGVTGMMSLTLADCIARADRYRIDALNPEQVSESRIVFLPTALGLPSCYAQMAGALSSYQLYAASMPAISSEAYPLTAAAGRFIELLAEKDLLNKRTVLVGWSMAGVLGYDILRLLKHAHRLQHNDLPALIMLDSGFAEGLHDVTFDEDFQRLMFAVELGLGIDKYADFNQQTNLNTKLQWLQQYLGTIGIEVNKEMLIEWWQAYHKRLKNLLAYQVDGGLVDADIQLLKAALHTHGRDDLGWQDNNNVIKWTSIQADHQSIVKSTETIERIRAQLL